MPRIRLLASSLALAICSITAAQAQQFSNVISFGDSLSDAGNIAALSGLPPGNSFTTNPDPVTVQIIAKSFGFDMTNISPYIPGSSGGSDYAWGGACLQKDSASFTCGPSAGIPVDISITTQLAAYLAGGSADPKALYSMWGGANDLFTYAALAGAGAINSTQALTGTATAAATEAALIGELQGAGAKNIIVFNLPNIAVTPDAAAQATAAGQAAAAAAAAEVLAHGGTLAEAQAAGQAAAQEAGAAVIQSLTGLSLMFNSTLNQSMAGKTGIIPVDVFGLVNEVFANPAAYGFSNITGTACSTGPGVGGAPSSVACGGPDKVGQLPYTYADGTNLSYFFADGVHPTGAGHALLAQYVLAELSAPSYVSMLGQTPLQVFDTQNRAIHDQMQADMGGDRQDGSLRSFASFDYSRQRFDAAPTSPQMSNHNDTLVMGADYYVNNAVSFGLSTTISHQDANFANGGGFQNNEPMGAAWLMWHSPDFYVSLLGSAGQLNFNGIDRVIQLGTATRIETGSTSGSHLGAELGAGYWFHWDDLKTGPFASISHQRVRVGSYSENGDDSTAMTFGRQGVNSSVSQIGWEFTGDNKAFGGSFHPFARVAYEHESDADPREVTAGLVGLNGTFTLPGYQPDSSYWTGQLGISAELGGNFSGFAAYSGHFGDSSERDDSFNLGLKWSW